MNLSESRHLVEALLAALPSMFAGTRTSESALGPALEAAFQVMQHIGGKMLVLQTALPTTGPGKLKQREAPKLLGGDKEHTLLAPDPGEEGNFYKNKAVDFSRQQISVDTYLFGSGAYMDVATVGALSRYTAGQAYFYPQYSAAVDGPRFASDLSTNLTRVTGFESVMRIRCSKGLAITNFYGNFFIRGTDLLALPNVTPATAFNVELSHEDGAGELAPGSTITIQAALLYTSTAGERRICVHTLCKPVTQLVADLFRSVDVDTLCNMIAKVALDQALRHGLHMARRYLHTGLVDIVRAYRAATSTPYGGGLSHGHAPGPLSRAPPAPGQLVAAQAAAADVSSMLPDNLQLLPLYALALMKSTLYRGGDQIRSDERAALVYRMLTMPVAFSRQYIYPRLFSLHDMDDAVGRPERDPSVPTLAAAAPPVPGVPEEPPVRLPPALNLTAERLTSDGVYLLDNGVELYLWVGKAAPPQLLGALFGAPSLEGVDTSQLPLTPQGNDYSMRVNALVRTLRRPWSSSQKLRIVREGSRDVGEARFHWHLVEDKQGFPGGDKSYGEYLPIVHRDSMQLGAMGGGGT